MKKGVNINLLLVLSLHRRGDWKAFQSPCVQLDRLQRQFSEYLLYFLWSVGIAGLVSDALLRNMEVTAWSRPTEQRQRIYLESTITVLFILPTMRKSRGRLPQFKLRQKDCRGPFSDPERYHTAYKDHGD